MRSLLWVVLVVFVGVVGYALVVQRNNVSPPAVSAPADDPSARPALIGSIEEIMEGIVEPAADVVFESVSTTISKAGVVQKRPQNDEEWARVEHNALALAESVNLITMAGRAVAPVVQSPTVTADPNAPELTPEENLTPAFFDLSSGEAGAILQKLRNYGIRLAVVCPPGRVLMSSRFGEMGRHRRLHL